jgi:proton-coupled amino acid transporter
LAFVVVFWFDFEHIMSTGMNDTAVWSWRGFPFFFAVAIYCYEGAGMILALEYSLAKPVRQHFRWCGRTV